MSNEYLDIALNKVVRQEVNKVLADIRAEIEESRYGLVNDGLDLALKIIDKHMRGAE